MRVFVHYAISGGLLTATKRPYHDFWRLSSAKHSCVNPNDENLTNSLLLLLRKHTDDHVAQLRSVHIILMMAPTFSSSALIAVITSHWLWLSFDYNYSVFDYTHLQFAKPR